MPKKRSPELEMLSRLNIGGYVIFKNEAKPMFSNAVKSYRVIECRKYSGKVLNMKGNKIKRIA